MLLLPVLKKISSLPETQGKVNPIRVCRIETSVHFINRLPNIPQVGTASQTTELNQGGQANMMWAGLLQRKASRIYDELTTRWQLHQEVVRCDLTAIELDLGQLW